MSYSKIKLDADKPQSLETEIMFNIASERAAGAELIMFEFLKSGDEKNDKKLSGTAVRLLKKMKSERKIQFYADEDSFRRSSTEAEFLYNKYPMLFEIREESDSTRDIFYVKL